MPASRPRFRRFPDRSRRRLAKVDLSRRSIGASARRTKTDPPSKNRVWGFFEQPASRTLSTSVNTQCSCPENRPTPTTTASGVRFYGYRYYNPDIGRWVNRDPIRERGGLNVYGFVGNRTISAVDPFGLSFWSWLACCDTCSEDDEPDLLELKNDIKPWTTGGSPQSDQNALDILSAVQAAGLVYAAGNIAGGATGGLGAGLLSGGAVIIDELMTSGWTDQMVAAIQAIGDNLINTQGAKIWIYIKWKECEEEDCWWGSSSTRLNWQTKSEWHECSAHGGSPNSPGESSSAVGVGFGMAPAAAAAAIAQQVPGCVEEAKNAYGVP